MKRQDKFILKRQMFCCLRHNGYTQQEIATVYGISRQRVNQIIGPGNGYIKKESINIVNRRKEIMKEQSNCQICNSKEQLEMHHINGDRGDNKRENLVMLCKKCHTSMHQRMRLLRKTVDNHIGKLLEETNIISNT